MNDAGGWLEEKERLARDFVAELASVLAIVAADADDLSRPVEAGTPGNGQIAARQRIVEFHSGHSMRSCVLAVPSSDTA